MSLVELIPAAIYACPIDTTPMNIEWSWSLQLGRCRNHVATMRTLYVVQERLDRHPATEGGERILIMRLLREGEAGTIRVLVVDRLRRLGTPPTVAVAMVERFAAVGVKVISAQAREDGPRLAAALTRFGIGATS